MDEDNMPMAFPDGHVYSREVRNILFFLHLARDEPFVSGAGRDGGKE